MDLTRTAAPAEHRPTLIDHRPPGIREQMATDLAECLDALTTEAGRFTCNEADSITHLYRLAGMDDAAAQFAEAHADADEPGDRHWTSLDDLASLFVRAYDARGGIGATVSLFDALGACITAEQASQAGEDAANAYDLATELAAHLDAADWTTLAGLFEDLDGIERTNADAVTGSILRHTVEHIGG